MAGIFLAAPSYVPSPVDADQWAGMTHTWAAWDGTIWDLTTGRSGIYLQSGVRGLTMPPIIRYSQKSPAVAGSRYRGSVVDEREVFWPLKLFKNLGSQEWLDHDAAFWRTMNPEETGTWTVTQPSGAYRSIDLRFVDDTNFAWDAEEAFGFAMYGITLIAEQPLWYGQPKTITWVPGSASEFFAAPGDNTNVFYISESGQVFGARIQNAGDVDAWPTWTVHGPFTTASVGVGTQQVSLPFTRSAGHYVTITTDPTEQTAIDDLGVDVTPLLGSVDFAPVPPGNPSDLNVTMTGTGSVDVSITPKYYRSH